MFFYAQINEDNIVVAISQLRDEINEPTLISINDYDESILDKKWNGTSFEDLPVLEPIPESSEHQISKMQFLALFTDAELVSILATAKDNIALSLYIFKMQVTSYIDLSDDVTIQALNGLQTFGLLTSERVAQILSNTPPQ